MPQKQGIYRLVLFLIIIFAIIIGGVAFTKANSASSAAQSALTAANAAQTTADVAKTTAQQALMNSNVDPSTSLSFASFSPTITSTSSGITITGVDANLATGTGMKKAYINFSMSVASANLADPNAFFVIDLGKKCTKFLEYTFSANGGNTGALDSISQYEVVQTGDSTFQVNFVTNNPASTGKLCLTGIFTN